MGRRKLSEEERLASKEKTKLQAQEKYQQRKEEQELRSLDRSIDDLVKRAKEAGALIYDSKYEKNTT